MEEIDQAAIDLREMLDRLTRLHVEMESVDTLYAVVEAAGQLYAEAAHLGQLLADAEEAVDGLEAELED